MQTMTLTEHHIPDSLLVQNIMIISVGHIEKLSLTLIVVLQNLTETAHSQEAKLTALKADANKVVEAKKVSSLGLLSTAWRFIVLKYDNPGYTSNTLPKFYLFF